MLKWTEEEGDLSTGKQERMKGGGEIPGGGHLGAGSEAVVVCPPGTSASIRFGFT